MFSVLKGIRTTKKKHHTNVCSAYNGTIRWNFPLLLRGVGVWVVPQRAATFISFHQTPFNHPRHLRTTPTVGLSNTHTTTLPAGSDGAGRATDGGWTNSKLGREERRRGSARRARGACFSSGGRNNSIHWVLASCLSEKSKARDGRGEKGG